MKNILVLLPLDDGQKARLRAICGEAQLVFTDARSPSAEQLRAANVILGFPRPDSLREAENLEFLQLSSSGADAYVKPGLLKPGTALCSATGAYGQAVGEHAFAMTWELIKKLHLYRDDQAREIWGDRGTVSSLRGATVLVVGLGDIGREYAQLCKAVGAHVIGLKRRPSPCPDYVDELYLTAELDRLLPEADVVCSVLPGTTETYHLFNAARFAEMKPGAVFVNCGRGTALDMDALNEALEKGVIAAAAADVMEVEPLPKGHPLWKQENMVITPHISGYFHLPGTLERIVDISFSNVDAWLHGGKLKNRIDFQTGYVN